MDGLRETSFRRVARVLREPDIEGALGIKNHPFPIGPNVHYLRCGHGYAVYLIDGEVAHLHGALTAGDGKHAGRLWAVHLDYLRDLGVRKITTRHTEGHRLASVMCRGLGFRPVECDPGFKRFEYEVKPHG